MAVATATADAAPETPPVKGGSRKKLLLVIAAAVLVLVAAAAAAVVLLGGFDREAPAAAADAASESPAVLGPEPVFVDLPQMLVNLAGGDGRPRFLKLGVAVEVGDPLVAERIQQLSPRIVDSFQMYLRTLTPDELQSPGAMFRLKEDLHVRIHQAIQPLRVTDVLFKEMLVQ